MRRMKYIYSLVLLLVTASLSGSNQQPVGLNVMTFNVRYDNPEDSLNNWRYRKDAAADMVRMYDVDIMGTQEVLANQMDDLKSRLTAYNAVGVGREDGKEKGEYCAIFYKKDRFTEVESGHFWLSETPGVAGSKGWDGACERIATWVILRERKTGTRLLFMNTHLDHVGKLARRKGVALLLSRARELGEGLPVIITGDFNARPESDVIKHMTGSGLFSDSKQMAEKIIAEGGTFHAFGRIPTEQRGVIDYIFVTEPLRVASYKVLPEKRNEVYLSDHTPVMARILIPGVQGVRIHSHNDYQRRMPFYQAYAQQLSSIEADVFATKVDGELLVAHDWFKLSSAPSLDETYIQPLVQIYKRNKGKAWKDSDQILTLLVDLKTPAAPTLNRLIGKLKEHPHVFDPAVNPYAVRVVVSGNIPGPERFDDYPPMISFDGNRTGYTPGQLERVAMISLNLRDYTRWNGKGKMITGEYEKVKAVIEQAHALGKPIRFWGTPDGVTAWHTFYSMGVDYINTDDPEACAAFFRDFHQKTYRINSELKDGGDVARAGRLDKATAGFQGFRNEHLQLTKRVDTYLPTYLNDGLAKPVRNVILLIGDGMGLAQICAADAINAGLSMLHIKHLGLQKTQARDSYATDSAAAGSALATGRKHDNRHISMSPEGEVYPSLTDVFYANGYTCGVLSLGNLSDATPAAFYGHSTERDNSDEITTWLLDGKLTFLGGSGMEVFTDRKDGKDMPDELAKAGYTIQTTTGQINATKGKVICIDERMAQPATEATITLLADATREAIGKLTETSGKGFFLMVEGAKIDYAGHANSLPGSILETLSFDLAVAEALRFADNNGETLVIVTADHETGGMALVDGDQELKSITVQYMTDDHTAIMVPVFVYGPQAHSFAGVYENTGMFAKLLDVTELK